jgi:ubiquinone/menaquinone biosynthesis C-methylase UbiE
VTESPNSQLRADNSGLSDVDKQRAREQWGANPCGANAARGLDFGTRDYFEAIAHERYNVYAPWMTEVIGFDRYPGRRLLEVGFGTGTDLLQFARGGARVTGVDLTPRSIDIAQRRFEVYGLKGQFLIGDGEYLSFPDASFDVVYSFGVLHHTPDTARAIREVHRVLRPGGEAIVMLYNRNSLAYWGGFVFKHGILKGRLLSCSIDEIMSRYAEHSETGGRPLVKAYTRAEAGRLFADFSHCDITVNQLTRRELRPFGPLLPESVFSWFARTFGWNLLIRATR